jgi:hypothetical protein
MRKIVLALALAACALTAGATAAPKAAECAYCYSGTCYNGLICGRCSCLKQGGSIGGVCVSLN